MIYPELLHECERDGIGPLFWTVLVEVTGRVARSGYPPEAYGETAWSNDAVHDLAQDVAVKRLIGENQLEYVLDLATDTDSLSRLLAFQVKRALSYRRAVTVVDRIVARARQIVLESDYRLDEWGSDHFISPSEDGRSTASLSDAELRRGSLMIDSIPRLASSPRAERESKVYRGSDLVEIVRVLVTEFDGISIRDVRKILEITLTAWLPTILRDYEEDHAELSTPELEAQRSEMNTDITRFVADLDSIHRVVLLGKAQGVSDDELARRLKHSRPWLADRKREVFELVEGCVSGLPTELLSEATRLLLDEAAALEAPND